MSLSFRQAAGATYWSALEILSRYGVQFLVTVVLARVLTPNDFGLIATLVAFASIGAMFVESGFGTALIQRQRTTADDEATVFAFSAFMGIAVALMLVFMAPYVAAFFNQPLLTPLMRCMSIVLPLSGLATVPDALLTMKLNFRVRTQAQLASSLVSGVSAVALALLGFGVWSLVWQQVIAAAVRLALLWTGCGWRSRGRIRAESFRTLAGFGSYMLLAGLLDTISTRAQSLLIGKLFDTRALGYYTLAQNAQQAPAFFIGGVLNRVGLPLFSTIADDRSKLKEALKSMLGMAMFLFVPCMIGIALAAKPLILLVYGEQWLTAAPMLSILAVSTSLWPVHVLNLAVISALGRSDILFRLNVMKALITTSLVLIGCPWGGVGVASAVLVSSVVGAIINTWYSGRVLQYGFGSQLSDQAAALMHTTVGALVGYGVLHWTKAGGVDLLIAILSSGLAFLCLALLVRPKPVADLLRLWRAIF